MQGLRLKSGEAVFDRDDFSHVHPGVVPFLSEALARIESGGREKIVEEIDFGKPVGESYCVATTDDDEIVYAQREGRAGLSRFVKSRRPEPCSAVTVVLKKDECGYEIRTAFIGHLAPPEPWDRNAGPDSLLFWLTHALIEEPGSVVIPGTETTEYPWEELGL